uniref:Uncharacterized protein n=1 Tax=Moniliophthora roreri TaxID=221103 RepID=A0A0W0GBW5_MONRR
MNHQRSRGAVDAVHGAGENIRGTALGAADTVAHDQSAKNDEIAATGRNEWANGLARIRGQPTSADTTTGAYGAEAYRESGVLGTDRHKGGLGLDGMGPRNHAPSPNTSRSAEYPQHHRDDAISNDPTAISIGQEHQNPNSTV